MWDTLSLVLAEIKARFFQQVHGGNSTLFCLLIKLKVELPSVDLGAWKVTVFVCEADTHLDQFEVVAVSFDHLIFKFVFGIWWKVDSSWVLRILRYKNRIIKIGQEGLTIEI